MSTTVPLNAPMTLTSGFGYAERPTPDLLPEELRTLTGVCAVAHTCPAPVPAYRPSYPAYQVTGPAGRVLELHQAPPARKRAWRHWSGRPDLWTVTLIEPDTGHRRALRCTTDAAYDLVTAWASRTSHTEALIAVGQALSEHSAPGTVTEAQALFTRTHDHKAAVPHRADGLFEVAGCAEPYPGAWPDGPLFAALSGDMSSLWPYLTAPADQDPQ